MRGVPEAVQPQDGLAPPHVPAHRREALHLRRVRQGLHPRGPDGEARGHAQEEGGARGWRAHVTAGRPLLAFSQPLVLSSGAPPTARRLSGSKDQLALLRAPQLLPPGSLLATTHYPHSCSPGEPIPAKINFLITC